MAVEGRIPECCAVVVPRAPQQATHVSCLLARPLALAGQHLNTLNRPRLELAMDSFLAGKRIPTPREAADAEAFLPRWPLEPLGGPPGTLLHSLPLGQCLTTSEELLAALRLTGSDQYLLSVRTQGSSAAVSLLFLHDAKPHHMIKGFLHARLAQDAAVRRGLRPSARPLPLGQPEESLVADALEVMEAQGLDGLLAGLEAAGWRCDVLHLDESVNSRVEIVSAAGGGEAAAS